MKATAKTIFAVIGLSGLVACSPNVPAGQATLGQNLTLGGGTFTSPGGISVAVEARDIGGRTGICGVWAESINQSVMTRNTAPRVLAGGGVAMEGKGVAQGLGFLRKVEPAESYAGMRANCITTERPWRAGDEARPLKVVLPRMVVSNESDEEGTMLIWFRPGGPGAHPSDKKPWYHLSGTSISGELKSDH